MLLNCQCLPIRVWVVYSKATLHHATTAVKYLSRYTHKIPISEQRLMAMDDTQVSLRWHDYRDGKDKPLQLTDEEIIRRFLQHVLPKGFMRIRHYGFLANRCRRQMLEQIGQCLKTPEPLTTPAPAWEQGRCPACLVDILRVCYELVPKRDTEDDHRD